MLGESEGRSVSTCGVALVSEAEVHFANMFMQASSWAAVSLETDAAGARFRAPHRASGIAFLSNPLFVLWKPRLTSPGETLVF